MRDQQYNNNTINGQAMTHSVYTDTYTIKYQHEVISFDS